MTGHGDDVDAALEEWEKTMRPSIDKHMRTAHFKHQVFVPSNRADVHAAPAPDALVREAPVPAGPAGRCGTAGGRVQLVPRHATFGR